MPDPAPPPPSDEPHLLAWLAVADAPCPVCGYNLRGVPAAVCPECAAPLRLQVGSPNLDLAPWFVATIAFALGAGFDLVISVLIVVGLFTVAPPGPKTPILIILTVFLCLGGISLTGLLANFRWRTAWPRFARKRQWWMAVVAFGSVGLGHAIVGLTLAAFFGM